MRPGGAPVLRPGEGRARAPARGGGGAAPRTRALPAAAAGRARPQRRRRQGPAARPARPAGPRPVGAGHGAAACPFPSRCRTSRCSSCTRTTSVRRSCCAWPAPGRPARTTSPATACSACTTSPVSLGLLPLPVPRRAVQAGARALAGLPFAPPFAEWAEAITRHSIMDTTKAHRDLGWRPRYSGLDTLRRTLPSTTKAPLVRRGLREETTAVRGGGRRRSLELREEEGGGGP